MSKPDDTDSELSLPVSQTMINSPGGKQAGRDLIIQAGPPPRSLPGQHIPKIVKALSVHAGTKVQISVVMGNNEAARLANDIHEVLKMAGWDVQNTSVLGFMTIGGPTPAGIELKTQGEPYPPAIPVELLGSEPLGILADLFQKLNFKPTIAREPDIESGKIYIQVGPNE